MKSARSGVGFPCLLAALVLSTVASPAGADTTLRWKFAAGQKHDYVMIQKTVMKMEVMGKQVETNYTQTADVIWEVKAVDKDGTAEMIQTIGRIRFDMMAPTGKIDVDTGKAEDAPGTPEQMTRLFRSMTGSPFTMKITPRGEISDVTIPAKMLEAFKEAGPVGAMLGSEESLKNMTTQSMVVFPMEAIAEGKSWKVARKLPMPFGTMVIDTAYTLEGAAGPVENLGIDAKIEIEPKPDSPFEIKVTSQDMKGHYRFDNEAGRLKLSEVVQKMSMTVSANGQQILQDLESTVKMELKKGGDTK